MTTTIFLYGHTYSTDKEAFNKVRKAHKVTVWNGSGWTSDENRNIVVTDFASAARATGRKRQHEFDGDVLTISGSKEFVEDMKALSKGLGAKIISEESDVYVEAYSYATRAERIKAEINSEKLRLLQTDMPEAHQKKWLKIHKKWLKENIK